MAPTIVLVHGAFAESASWDRVIDRLLSAGCTVISNVAADGGEIAGRVYVAGFAPESGESANALATMFPRSTLGEALQAVPRRDGTTGLFIAKERFHAQFAADVPAPQTARMAATQRPATLQALEAAAVPGGLTQITAARGS